MGDGDGGGGLFWPALIVGAVGLGYVYRNEIGLAPQYDAIVAWIKARLGGGGGCTKTCTGATHLDVNSCTCVPNTCTKTCTLPQVIDAATCTCKTPVGCTKTCTPPQVLNAGTCTCENVVAGGSLSFAAGGDAGTGRHPEPSVSIAKMVKSKGAQLFVGLGDYPYDSVCGGFSPFVNALGGVQNIWSEGNHDKDSCLTIFKQPKWVFRLDKGPCTFIVLNGNSFGSAATQLDDLMKQATPRKWKFVCFHQPILTPKSDHGAASGTAIKPILKKYGVQAVLQAHNHIYARSKRDADGVTYFVLGTLGESHYSTSTGSPWVITNNKDFGATFFNCTDSACTGQFINTGGKVIDTFSL